MNSPNPPIGASGSQVDSVVRRQQFEAAHPEVTIVAPVGTERWRAIVPLGSVPGQPDATMVGEVDLDHLMDRLDLIFPPGGTGPIVRCVACMLLDPPPTMTCHQGRDHRVGFTLGCPCCGRLVEACAYRPCATVRLALIRA